jgi:NADPH:quinone reductase-like Zn-dependent oxidoreductase
MHQDAVSIPHVSMLAYQGLIRRGELSEGMDVLINGGGGGVGAIALQLAKLKKCRVTGVDTGPKLERMKNWGFDRVIDYKQEDFTKLKDKYDLILDPKTTRGPWARAQVLKKGGKYVTVGGTPGTLLRTFFFGRWVGRMTGTSIRILGVKPNHDLAEIEALIEKGQLKTTIDGPYPFEDIPKQITRFGAGEHHGKIVIKVI